MLKEISKKHLIFLEIRGIMNDVNRNFSKEWVPNPLFSFKNKIKGLIILANKTELLALEIGDKVAKNLGMSVVDAEFKKEDGRQILRLFIDKEGGVGIDDCETFSRSFESEMDKDDPIETEYVLEVSSPGVERKLKTEREFLHYIGSEVDVKLFSALSGKKEFTGILKSFENDKITFLCDNELIEINKKDAAFVKLHFEF